MKSFARCLFFVVAFIFISTSIVDAKFYVWKDKDGVTHYSDTEPPVADQKYKTIEQNESEEAQENNSSAKLNLPGELGLLRYDGTRKSLKRIHNAVIPYAEKGNRIAIEMFICSGYGLALDLKNIYKYYRPVTSANTSSEEELWWGANYKNYKSGDVFFETVHGALLCGGELHSVWHPIKFKTGLKLFIEAGEEGYPDAFCRLGFLYLQRKQKDKAYECYRKAAEKGSVIGNFRMGMKTLDFMPYDSNFYTLMGKGKKKREQALGFLVKAAEGGYAPAQFYLGSLYHLEMLIIKNKNSQKFYPAGWKSVKKKREVWKEKDRLEEKSKKWFKKAKDQGYRDYHTSSYLRNPYKLRPYLLGWRDVK